jgi:hypothetical protein
MKIPWQMDAHGAWRKGDWTTVRSNFGWNVYRRGEFMTTQATLNDARKYVAIMIGEK